MLQVVMDICKIEHFLKILKLQRFILKERRQIPYICHYINIKLNGFHNLAMSVITSSTQTFISIIFIFQVACKPWS